MKVSSNCSRSSKAREIEFRNHAHSVNGQSYFGFFLDCNEVDRTGSPFINNESFLEYYIIQVSRECFSNMIWLNDVSKERFSKPVYAVCDQPRWIK